jgi:Cu/Ag efflux pump CusA
MIDLRVVAAQPFVACAALFLIGWGIRAIYCTPVDAIPILVKNQVIARRPMFTAGGRGPVIYPLSVNLQAWQAEDGAGAMFGFSLITGF